MIKLEDYVKETISEIVEGVQNANFKKAVIPHERKEIKFEIEVFARENKETKGGVGIFVGAFGLGSQGKSENDRETTSKITFEVPIVFKSTEKVGIR